MDDKQIINLYIERSENAISETAGKYGKYCHQIAYNILYNTEDSEECVNDTYLKAWNNIPPQIPQQFKAFLGKITRNLALDKYKYYNRDKRGNGQVTLALDELQECVPAMSDVEQAIADMELVEVFNRFLEGLPAEKRKIFMRRYWYLSSLKEIANDFAMTESKVKMILYRVRCEFKEVLEKEGIIL